MPFIFLSYSHSDREYANLLADSLEAKGLDVWIDEHIDYGALWSQEIQDHLDKCAAFVVVMTPNSENSDWVKTELARAQRKKKHIFPLLLDGEVWFEVETKQYADVQGGKLPPDRFYKGLARIVNADRPSAAFTTSSRDRLQTELNELEDRFNNLTRRLAAVNKDLGRALDSELKQTLEERQSELTGKREEVSKRMEQIERDLAKLQSLGATSDVLEEDAASVNRPTRLGGYSPPVTDERSIKRVPSTKTIVVLLVVVLSGALVIWLGLEGWKVLSSGSAEKTQDYQDVVGEPHAESSLTTQAITLTATSPTDYLAAARITQSSEGLPFEARTATATMTPSLAVTKTQTPTHTPSPTPTTTVTPTSSTGVPSSTKAIVAAQDARFRSGPGIAYPIMATLARGTELDVLGRNADGSWLFLRDPDDRPGWMSALLLDVNTDVATLPTVTAPPPPSPTATKATPSTATPTPTILQPTPTLIPQPTPPPTSPPSPPTSVPPTATPAPPEDPTSTPAPP